MRKNKFLAESRKARRDEFYTLMPCIEKEFCHYREHFRGKTVYCNCDNPFKSNFFRYFVQNFNNFGLKSLVATCYVEFSPENHMPVLFEDCSERNFLKNKPCMARITTVENTSAINIHAILEKKGNSLLELVEDGDFRSRECVEILKEADIVATNPPFSLFREYMAMLLKHKKKFLVLGNINAIASRELFPFFKSNEVWLGQSIHSGDVKFFVPDDYNTDFADGWVVDRKGRKFIRVSSTRWFTNLACEQGQYPSPLELVKKYAPEAYPKYENYDAIDVGRTADIPKDYYGVMGVPITFLDKYNPSQFEIVGITKRNVEDSCFRTREFILYDCDNYKNLNSSSVLQVDGELKTNYIRILIRRKTGNAIAG